MATVAGGAIWASALASGVSAGGATQVAGLGEPDVAGVCQDAPEAVGAYVMSGSLTGCWYVDTAELKNESQTGFLAVGTEHFVGCLGAACGTILTTYTFTAKLVDGVEVHGRCHHPIVGGTGAFAGISGSFDFHDLPDGCATYHGVIRF